MSILSLVNSVGSTFGSTVKRAVMSPTLKSTLQIRSMSSVERTNWDWIKSLPGKNTTPEVDRSNLKNAVAPSFSRPPGPYAGRSVAVTSNRSFTGAYMELQQVLRKNLVSYELRLAERHEKKGYKRRRLESDRHRRRFAHEVRKKVQLVNEIRARGA